jgi:hypothetical protein
MHFPYFQEKHNIIAVLSSEHERMVDVNTTKQNPYASLQNDVIYNEVS